MAESNANRPAPERLTTEEVDRLSERFKPSWESEPQTTARPEPARAPLKQTMVGGTAPALPLAPARPAVTAPPAGSSVQAAPAPAVSLPAGASLAAKPMTAVVATKAGLEVAKTARHPTLVGIAPQAIRQVSGAPHAAPDDLDWELPAGEQPTPPSDMAQTARLGSAPGAGSPPTAEASRIQPVQLPPQKLVSEAAMPSPAEGGRAEPDGSFTVDIEEVPPESKPSGIAQKYVPREQGAPAIVLNDEVQRTEAQALATIEAQHRARSAPTIAKMPAVRAPASAADLLDEDTVSHRRGGRGKVWAVLVVLVLGATALAVVMLRKPDPPRAAAPPRVEKPVAAVDTVAPPPPAVAPDPPPPTLEVKPVAAPTSDPPPASTSPTATKQAAKVAATAPPAAAPVEAPKRAAAPVSRPAAKPKPAPTAKPASSPTRPSKSSVIVRDNPF